MIYSKKVIQDLRDFENNNRQYIDLIELIRLKLVKKDLGNIYKDVNIYVLTDKGKKVLDENSVKQL